MSADINFEWSLSRVNKFWAESDIHARTRQTTLNFMTLQQRQNAEQLFATLSEPSSCCMLFPYMLTFCCNRVSSISESLSTLGSDEPQTVRLTIKGAPFFPNCAIEDAFGAFKRIWHVKVGQPNEFAGLSTFGPFLHGLEEAALTCFWTKAFLMYFSGVASHVSR